MARIQMAFDLDAQEYVEMTVIDPVATEVVIIKPVIHWRQANKVTPKEVQAFWQAHPEVADEAFCEGVNEALETWPEEHGFGSSDRFWAAFNWTLRVMQHGGVFRGAQIYCVNEAQARQDEQDAWAIQAADYAREARGA